MNEEAIPDSLNENRFSLIKQPKRKKNNRITLGRAHRPVHKPTKCWMPIPIPIQRSGMLFVKFASWLSHRNSLPKMSSEQIFWINQVRSCHFHFLLVQIKNEKFFFLFHTEAFAILMNISSPTHDICPMPEGFSVSIKPRTYNDNPCMSTAPPLDVVRVQPFYGFSEEQLTLTREPTFRVMSETARNIMETRKFYATRTIRQHEAIDYFNTSVSDCSLTFMVDRSICITGIQVPTQVIQFRF